MKKILLVFFFTVNLFAVDATMTVYNKGKSQTPDIVLQDASGGKVTQGFKDKFFQIILEDLKVTTAFKPNTTYGAIADFYAQGANSSSGDLVLRYRLTSDKTADFKVIDVKSGKELFNRSYSVDVGLQYPFLSHYAIADIAQAIAYLNVDWMKKMLLMSVSNGNKYDILRTDYSLRYKDNFLRNVDYIFPKWANYEQSQIYYTDMSGINPTIYLYDLKSKSRKPIFTSQGMAIVSDISSNGNTLVLTIAPDDQADIYLYNINSKILTKLTKYSGIDVNGNFVDNEKRVAFVSDRLGYPTIYAVDVNTLTVEQLVFQGKNNNSISTYKNYIVYSSREANRDFNLYLISTTSNNVRKLTNGGKNSFPRLSIDGGTVIFIKELSSGSAIGIIRLNENQSFQFPLNLGKIQSIDL